MSGRTYLEQVLQYYPLTVPQEEAVRIRGQDLLVTAGAGSGKTRTLVARYLALLAEGFSPRQVVAVTFTEKAAREMRNRVRKVLQDLQEADKPETGRFWLHLVEQVDTARIGTIHSLCAELVRAHPAEACVDPQFEVLDDGLAAMLRLEAVERALEWAAAQFELTPLFSALGVQTLQQALQQALEKRLDYMQQPWQDPETVLAAALHDRLAVANIDQGLADLECMRAQELLLQDAGEDLAAQIAGLLEAWRAVQQNLADGDPTAAAQGLHALRRSGLSLRRGKRDSQAREILRRLQASFDLYLDPLTGGSQAHSAPLDRAAELMARQVNGLFQAVVSWALAVYEEEKARRQALDFDDLELLAWRLLCNPGIQKQWQGEIEHLLVDEFQDTNRRQRDIILALAGDRTGRLFLVGDAQQSIYRFRGADVEVFRGLRIDIERRGGRLLALDTTFRCARPVLEVLEALLRPVIGEKEEPGRPYAVPYRPMSAVDQTTVGSHRAPYVEFILGAGNAISGRQAAAHALADRLIAMKNTGEIGAWDDVALLFQASTGFNAYEEAFSRAGIPFVTVAGIGFYERPEIRNLLNALRAFSDPWDDAAMAGFLRSPGIGLKDSSLISLRGLDRKKRPFVQALYEYATLLPEGEHPAAQRALEVLERFMPVANRWSAADLLDALVVELDYRAILMVGGPRLVRNVDKLLDDARSSEPMPVTAFLAYLQVSRDAGARAGEAVSEANGAVRLMTIHKAKGLEFSLVVLADASHARPSFSPPLLVLPQTGPTLRMAGPLGAYRYARLLDGEREGAESLRLLYVACTRSRHKLILSGYVNDNGAASGFLNNLGVGVAGKDAIPRLSMETAIHQRGCPQAVELEGGCPVLVSVHDLDTLAGNCWQEVSSPPPPTREEPYLYLTLPGIERTLLDDEDVEESRLEQRDWSAVSGEGAPAVAVGKLVHKALQRWCFPGDAGFDRLMMAGLVREGVLTSEQQKRVLQEVCALLQRFQRHALYAQANRAERRHEVPYALPLPADRADTGVIDLLFGDGAGWRIVDFKTDALANEAVLHEKVEAYRPQLLRYLRACRRLVRGPIEAVICFLDGPGGEVRLQRIAG